MVAKLENLPKWDGRRGWYEVWYATVNEPVTGYGFWFRYTLHVPPDPGTPADVAVWGFAFTPDGPDIAGKRTVPLTGAKLHATDAIVELDDAVLAEGRLVGSVADDRGRILRWDLAYEPAAESARPLPRALERVAPAYYLCPNLDVPARGSVWIDGRRLELRSASLGQSHIWGRHHAGAWAWIHVRVPSGPLIDAIQVRPHVPGAGEAARALPARPFAVVEHRGRRRRFGPFGISGRYAFGVWHLVCTGPDARLHVTAQAPSPRFVQVTYHDPGGADVFCANTEVGDATVEVLVRSGGGWRTDETHVVRGTAHLEFGSRTAYPEVPVAF